MPYSPEVQQNFNATVYGVAGKVAGDQIIYPSSQKQDLAEAAAEIQRLLKQLEEFKGWQRGYKLDRAGSLAKRPPKEIEWLGQPLKN